MALSRRDFVRAGSTAALLQALPRIPLVAQAAGSRDRAYRDTLAMRGDSQDTRDLALRAVDAARAAGASYADVRLTRTITRKIERVNPANASADVSDREFLGFGVRALVNGYWGFAASPYWERDEAAQLASAAVSQAKTNALGSSRLVELEPIPPATGHWVTPGIDPFTVPIEEKIDFMNAWAQAVVDAYIPAHTLDNIYASLDFVRQESYMASTENAFIAQTLYTTEGEFRFTVDKKTQTMAKGLYSQRGGWDVVLDANVRNQIPVMVENAVREMALSSRPVDIGRYDVVFDASSSAALLSRTIGDATQIDRAMGLEANAVGTSYLGPDPLEFLGTVAVGAPLLNVTANRSMPKGNATVQWDDEGVEPDEFALVKDGRLVDYQTTREQASWLKAWYARQGRPVRSHGCAAAISALDWPVQQTPNLALQPGTAPASFDTLVAGIQKGYAIMNAGIESDFQGRNGLGGGFVREIVNGKLGDIVQGAGFLFGALEIWRNLTALGDRSTIQHSVAESNKGEPDQSSKYSITSVPIAVKNVSIIEMGRRA